MKDIKPWDTHYTRSKSKLLYPDENLVRMLKSYLDGKVDSELAAIDIGCGSGRHLNLLDDLEIKTILGLDNSMNALSIAGEIHQSPLIQGDNIELPFKEDVFDIAVSWGSLHYCEKYLLDAQLKEIQRILKNHGRFFGTLRSRKDTHLQRGKDLGRGTWITDIGDIKNQVVSFYNEEELQSALGIFNRFEYGIIERTIIGDMKKLISHWIFWAEK